MIADGIDQNCDGQEVCFLDGDGDGYRLDQQIGSANPSCADPGEALASAAIDCDDAHSFIHPGAMDRIGDGWDADCDGVLLCFVDLDDDWFRPDETSSVASTNNSCGDPGEAWQYQDARDCNDGEPAVRPGAPEVTADGVDQDCDGFERCFVDADDDGHRPPTNATSLSAYLDCGGDTDAVATDPADDCDETSSSRYPGAVEVVGDEVDQDCDARELCFTDSDGDGHATTAPIQSADADCRDPGEAKASAPRNDCNDADATVNPASNELAGDGVDQDCTGMDLTIGPEPADAGDAGEADAGSDAGELDAGGDGGSTGEDAGLGRSTDGGRTDADDEGPPEGSGCGCNSANAFGSCSLALLALLSRRSPGRR